MSFRNLIPTVSGRHKPPAEQDPASPAQLLSVEKNSLAAKVKQAEDAVALAEAQYHRFKTQRERLLNDIIEMWWAGSIVASEGRDYLNVLKCDCLIDDYESRVKSILDAALMQAKKDLGTFAKANKTVS